MAKKEDIGHFIKKAFDQSETTEQPDNNLWEKIDTSLNKQKVTKRLRIFWFTAIGALIVAIGFFILPEDRLSKPSKETNNTPQLIPFSKEQDSNLKDTQSPTKTKDSIAAKTISQNKTEQKDSQKRQESEKSTELSEKQSKPNKPSTHKNSTQNSNLEDHYQVKTTYHYYRDSDSLKVETSNKHIIDSILSRKENHQKTTDSLPQKENP